MIAVIFQITPCPGKREIYLEVAAALRPELDRIDGFISIERFESLTVPGNILSLSFWRDDAAVRQWRNMELHRQAQRQGRSSLFADYQLRIGEIIRDYGLNERKDAPQDSRDFHSQ